MQAVILKAGPHNQFHLGRNTLEHVHHWMHSDTLFSALVNTYNKIFPASTDDLVEQFSRGKISVSSAFHCLEGGADQWVFFLPKPLPYHYQHSGNYKAGKKVAFFSLGVWKANPKPGAFDVFQSLSGTHLITHEEVKQMGMEEKNLPPRFFLKDWAPTAEITYPKVRVQSLSQEGVYYHQVNLQLQRLQTRTHAVQTHLYFLLDHALPESTEHQEKASWSRLQASLQLLGDEGIGGERSSGCGQLAGVEIREAKSMGFPQADNTQTQCLLSLGIPANQAELNAFRHYQLKIRGGGSLGIHGKKEQHRSQVRMIAEGAIFEGKLHGKLADVSPPDLDKPIKRNGIIFSLPYSI